MNADLAPTSANGSAVDLGPLDRGSIRGRLLQLSACQQQFELHLAHEMHVDPLGLATLDHLMTMGATTSTELAERFEIPASTMESVVEGLVQAGHVRREPHPADPDQTCLQAEADSVVAAGRLVGPLVAGVEDLIDSLSQAQRRVVGEFIDAMIELYDEATLEP